MKLLHVIHYPVFGGPHNQALRLNEALAEQGWDSVVALPAEPGNAAARLADGGVKVRRLRLDRLRASPSLRLQLRFLCGFVPGVKRLRDLIRSEEVDLVVVGGLVNPHAALAARLEKKPVVWQLLDTSAPKPLVHMLMPIVKRLADAVLVTGVEVAEAHPGLASLGDRVLCYFPPVDTEQFKMNQELRLTSRKELGLAERDVVVGSVSNVNPDKDQLTFVMAAAGLRTVLPEVRFVIMGARYPQHADYVAKLERTAHELGLTVGADLIFHDPGPEVARFGMALDVFWLTSRSEGIPTVIEEAMALGLPVVATDVGSVRRAVDDGLTGFVVPVKDPKAIALHTADLLGDAELCEEFGERARVRAENDFSISTCAETHLEAFAIAIQHASARFDD